jgi:hypothetical protein
MVMAGLTTESRLLLVFNVLGVVGTVKRGWSLCLESQRPAALISLAEVTTVVSWGLYRQRDIWQGLILKMCVISLSVEILHGALEVLSLRNHKLLVKTCYVERQMRNECKHTQLKHMCIYMCRTVKK